METIILIHGWNYKNYTKFGCKDPWDNRRKFVDELKKYFNVITFNLPGFCGKPEPKENSWNLNSFATFFQNFLLKNNIQPDFVLGYSFGGAVAVQWKINFPGLTKLILISPAISRAYSNKNIKHLGWWNKEICSKSHYKLVKRFLFKIYNKKSISYTRNTFLT